MRIKMAILGGLGTLLALGLAAATAQEPGVGQKLGQALDNAGRKVRDEAESTTEAVRRRFDTMAADVHRMGTIPRVYSRLHWDKALNGSRIEVHGLRAGVVGLRGVVPDEAARKRAEELAASTVDVQQVVNELTIAAPSAPAAPAAPAPAARPAPARR
jgi:hypothetical protein